MLITEEQIRERLREVIDPELGVNIVDMGLVYKIQATSAKSQRTKIKIVMTLTSPGCPLAGLFDGMVRGSLGEFEGVDVNKDVEIELTFDPPWTPEMMTDRVRAELGFD